jgi:hypothetical protein
MKWANLTRVRYGGIAKCASQTHLNIMLAEWKYDLLMNGGPKSRCLIWIKYYINMFIILTMIIDTMCSDYNKEGQFCQSSAGH